MSFKPAPQSLAPTRILLVDDVEPWRRAVGSLLRTQEQLQVVGEAVDGQEAIQKAQELQPDLILLDVGLPKLNGIEAASRIEQVASSAKILFLTQNTDVEIVQAALSNGAHGYVLKADAGSELLPAIKAVLRGGKFISNRLTC